MQLMTFAEAEDFFAELFMGKHHIPPGGVKAQGGKVTGTGPERLAMAWCVNAFSDVATYDASDLTRFVFLAHDCCFRGTVLASGPRLVKLMISKRIRYSDSIMTNHPTIEQAVKKWRKTHPVGAVE